MGEQEQGSVTRLVNRLRTSAADEADEGFLQVYEELRKMAARELRRERPNGEYDTTALVHEAFLRLTQGDQVWESRAHFFGAAARAMRRVLVEAARRRISIKRGQERDWRPLAAIRGRSGPIDPLELLALDEALSELEGQDTRLSDIVLLRCFAGLSVAQTASVLGVSERTCKRDWAFARAWLYRRLGGGGPSAA